MKKLAFVVVLVAAIVGIVFGGISVASAGHLLPPTNTQGPTNTPHSTCTPKPTPTPDCCVTMLESINALSTQVTNLQSDVTSIKTELGNVTKMDTISGHQVIAGDSGYLEILPETYPEVRHVSLSLRYAGLDLSGGGSLKGLSVNARFGGIGGDIAEWSTMLNSPTNGWITIDFNTDQWGIWTLCDGNSDSLYVYYSATITYATSP